MFIWIEKAEVSPLPLFGRKTIDKAYWRRNFPSRTYPSSSKDYPCPIFDHSSCLAGEQNSEDPWAKKRRKRRKKKKEKKKGGGETTQTGESTQVTWSESPAEASHITRSAESTVLGHRCEMGQPAWRQSRVHLEGLTIFPANCFKALSLNLPENLSLKALQNLTADSVSNV